MQSRQQSLVELNGAWDGADQGLKGLVDQLMVSPKLGGIPRQLLQPQQGLIAGSRHHCSGIPAPSSGNQLKGIGDFQCS